MKDPEYERMYLLEDRYWWFVGRRRLVEALLRARYKPGGRPEFVTLDVGCGTGAMSARLRAWGRVVSMDFSPLALKFARRRGLNGLIQGDAMRLPFAACSFDCIVIMDVLEHLKHDDWALAEFHRVLKPGGRLVATVPAYMHLWSEHDVALMHFRRYVRREVRQRLAESGLIIEKLSHSMMLLYPVVAAQRRLNGRKPPHNPPAASMPAFPAPINRLLTGLLFLENQLAQRLSFPVGVTIVSVARKPDNS